jgi:hypothetical protein
LRFTGQLGGPNVKDPGIATQALVNPCRVQRAFHRSVTGPGALPEGDGDGQTILSFDGQTMLAGGFPSLLQVTWYFPPPALTAAFQAAVNTMLLLGGSPKLLASHDAPTGTPVTARKVSPPVPPS